MSEAIEEIKRRTSLVELIGEYVSLKKAGGRHKGLCPFHGEKTPSFHVNDERGFYYCFGCGASGDAITFLRDHVGYSFVEALRLLADRVGIELPDRVESHTDGATRIQRQETRDRYYEANAAAQQFFRRQLGAEALGYLEGKRGLTREFIDSYGLGFAPDSWDALVGAVSTSPGGVRDAASLGLIARRERGQGHYSKFRYRVMFPVYALSGQIAGFSGRTLSSEKDVPKYVNSSESEVYVKGHMLYGLYQARRAVRDRKRAIVVEGNVDVVTLAQAGLPETVAPLGTALTADQCHLLKRFTRSAILVYDGDRAGRAAAIKAIPALLDAGLSGRVVSLPDGEDPDSFVGREGVDALEALIARAPSLFEHFLNGVLETYDGSVPGKSAVIAAAGPVYALVSSTEEREIYARRLATVLDVLEGQVQRWLRDARGSTVTPPMSEPGPAPQQETNVPHRAQPAPRRERELMKLLLHHPELLPFWDARGGPHTLTHQGVARVLDFASQLFVREGRLDGLELIEALGESGLDAARRVVGEILSTEDIYGDRAERAFVDLADALRAKAVKRQRAGERARLAAMPASEVLAELRARSGTK